MASYIIKGGASLKGSINISGNKNSILPCLAATILVDQEVTLRNVPKIVDVEVLIESNPTPNPQNCGDYKK